MNLRTRLATGLVLLALAPGLAQALQVHAAVSDAPPTLAGWDLRAASCAPPGTVTPGGSRACIHARDANGHQDLCAPRALRNSTVTAVLASGQAVSLPLSCVAAAGRDAWMEAALPPQARTVRLLKLHLEDAWGATAEADLALDASPDASPPQRHQAPLPSRRLPVLLP